MQRAPTRPQNLAAGYASDDERKTKPLPWGFGALPGDDAGTRRLSGQAAVSYQVRQASGGPVGSRVRYLDTVLAPERRRLAPAQTRARGAYDRHAAWLSCLRSALRGAAAPKNDLQLLRESHRFLRSDGDEDGSWEAKLARKYYDRLFREYVLCDLTGYKAGRVGFRWRTESEVIQGKGQFWCGRKRCDSRQRLQSYEVDFKYVEAGEGKRALVKVRLCERCAYKLHYRRLRRVRKRRKQESCQAQKRAKIGLGMRPNVEIISDSASCCSGSNASALSSADDGGDAASATVEVDHEVGDIGSSNRAALEALAWRGPDPALRTREDDFDDYFNDLLA